MKTEELADALTELAAKGGPYLLLMAADRLRAQDGERIEGCVIGSAFIRENYGGDSITVQLPLGGSQHKMLLHRCTLIVHPE